MARSPVAARVVGRAALDPRDREDARRGHPAVDLTAFARARGLEPLGSQNPSGYAAALPMEPELQSNVVRGTVGGRDVVLWHWRHPWPLDDDGPVGRYTFYDRVSVQRSSLRSWFTGSGEEQYVGVPCTGVATLTPEAGLLPPLRVVCGPGTASVSRRAVDLGPAGLPGAALDPDGPLPEGLAAALARGPLGAVVRAGSRHALFDVTHRFGTTVLRRNGYVTDERELDGLLAMAVDAGTALAAACRPLTRPQPFARPLPPAGTEPLPQELVPPPAQLAALHALARRHGLVAEDPRAYTAAFPGNPVPGLAWAVLRGALPGLPPTTRLALHTEAPVGQVNTGRTALVLPAGDAAPTPPGGLRVDVPGARLRLAVHGGLWTFSVLRRQPLDLGDVDLLLAHGAQAARHTGALPA